MIFPDFSLFQWSSRFSITRGKPDLWRILRKCTGKCERILRIVDTSSLYGGKARTTACAWASLGSRELQMDFYVGDCLIGANSLVSTTTMKNEICDILGTTGFKLRKWAANHSKLLEGLTTSHTTKRIMSG